MNRIKFANLLKHVLLIGTAMCCLFSSCVDGDKFDGLVLTDENTGKKYLLIYNIGDTYMIREQVFQISGKDTSVVFK